MSKSWEVDPETRRKLLDIQKRDGNNACCDCTAPAPQWASPKFGIFMCLSCAGVHRGLGVHISFVRSITMDSFKTDEILRMDKGGNKKCKEFFAQADGFYEGMSTAERYSSTFGEDYKEKLTAEVEGREWVRTERPKPPRSSSSISLRTPERTNTTTRADSAFTASKDRNEAYFARLSGDNAQRPDHLPPSQGGKYGGFGSAPAEPAVENGQHAPGLDEFTRDPVGALTKSFGFFTTQVTKVAKTANESILQPTAQRLAEADLGKHAATLGQRVNETGRAGFEGLNRFVENSAASGARQYRGISGAGPDEEHKDFWESFGKPEEKPAALGTSAMKKPAAGGSGGMGASSGKKDDGWDDW